MHVDASDIYPSALVFYTRHRVNITIYRTVYLHTDMCLQTLTQLSSIVAIFLQFLTITSLSGHLSDFFKSNFLFHIHFSVVICDFLMKSSQITIVLMHVSFKIQYRNNLIDKKYSYLISCLPSWDERNYSDECY